MDIIEAMSRYAEISERNEPVIFVHKNKTVRKVTDNGLKISSEDLEDRVKIRIDVRKNIEKLHLCFAVLDTMGRQNIDLDIYVADGCSANFISHCVFPYAKGVVHISKINFHIGHGARVHHEETHIHPQEGKIKVKAKVTVRTGIKARVELLFTARHGRAGILESTTHVELGAGSGASVMARIYGRKDDSIKLNEKLILQGCESHGSVKTRVVLKDSAKSEVYSEVIGVGKHSRGHIDCTEILMDKATAKAYPIVDVREPTAKLTHEAAIGRVDEKQILTLLCRGMSEEEATEFIVQGILG